MNPEISSNDRFIDRLGRMPALDGIADALQPPLQATLDASGAGAPVKDALHGTWLGHSLHPILTDVPIGAWTVSAICDVLTLLGGEGYARAADTSAAIGALGAIGAAITGLADWSDTQGEPKRLGVLHALVNGTALALYTGSLIARRSGARGAGIVLGLGGFAVVGAGAYLGGELVAGMQIGVKRTALAADPPAGFIDVLAASDLAAGATHAVEAGGIPVLLTRGTAGITATAAVCTHRGAPLADGETDGACITCPWHGSRFSLVDGGVIEGPATFPLARFETRVVDGRIEVRPLR